MTNLIIILNWNNSKLTINLVNQLLELDDNCHYCIVDNNSNKEDTDVLRQFFEKKEDCFIGNNNQVFSLKKRNKFYLVLNENNYGYAKGNNIGAKLGVKLNYSFFIFSNNDILLVEPVINTLINEIKMNKKVAMVGPKIEDTLGNQQGPFQKETLKHNFIFSLFFPIIIIFKKLGNNFFGNMADTQLKDKDDKLYRLMGCFFAVNASIFKGLDYFDEKTFLYYEEAILSSKIFKNGYEIVYNSEIKVVHLDSMSTKMISHSLLKYTLESGHYYFKTYRGYNKLQLILFSFGKKCVNNFWLKVLNWIK